MTIKINLNGKVAVVTGAGRGIGRAIALALGENGATVIAAARTESQISKVSEEINKTGGNSTAFCCDIADESQIIKLFSFVMEKYKQIDILVNNAAIGRFGPFKNFSTNELDELLTVNIRGTFICCREAMQRMIPRKSGTIINLSSVVGFKGYENQSAYTASKHAVVGITKSLAVEAQQYNIRASVIHPGGVDTQLVDDARPDLDRSELMQPEDVAHTIMFLLSLSERCAVDEIYIRRRGSSPF